MTAINHAITGAVIGFLVSEPLVALPIALLSHFVCDALPHFGLQDAVDHKLRGNAFRNYLLVDGSLCVLLVIVLVALHPQQWLLAACCAFLATAPDMLWVNRYAKARSNQPWRPSRYSVLAAGLQWFERPIGGVVEVAWLFAGLSILLLFL